MSEKPFPRFAGLIAGWLSLGGWAFAEAPSTPAEPTVSESQRVLQQAGREGKFTFLVFYKADNPAFRGMAKVAKDGAERRGDKAVATFVQVSDPAEKPLVDKFDVGRAPMPLTVAVAPNLAVTGIFAKQLQDEQLEAALVTPTMTRCMKALQEGKLVFVCVAADEKAVAPPAVKALRQDADFADRVVVIPLELQDPQETRFLQQLQVDPRQTRSTVAALLAPPGLLIGKYGASATKDQVIAALNKAGKCCNDPNCKHNRANSAPPPAKSGRK